jgi:hypothetical protein
MTRLTVLTEPDAEGITIVRPEDDLGPASKVLFAARELRRSVRPFDDYGTRMRRIRIGNW